MFSTKLATTTHLHTGARYTVLKNLFFMRSVDAGGTFFHITITIDYQISYFGHTHKQVSALLVQDRVSVVSVPPGADIQVGVDMG